MAESGRESYHTPGSSHIIAGAFIFQEFQIVAAENRSRLMADKALSEEILTDDFIEIDVDIHRALSPILLYAAGKKQKAQKD